MLCTGFDVCAVFMSHAALFKVSPVHSACQACLVALGHYSYGSAKHRLLYTCLWTRCSVKQNFLREVPESGLRKEAVVVVKFISACLQRLIECVLIFPAVGSPTPTPPPPSQRVPVSEADFWAPI